MSSGGRAPAAMLQHQPQASSNPATALSEARTGAATVLSCGHSAPQHAEEDVQSYGANSPVRAPAGFASQGAQWHSSMLFLPARGPERRHLMAPQCVCFMLLEALPSGMSSTCQHWAVQHFTAAWKL